MTAIVKNLPFKGAELKKIVGNLYKNKQIVIKAASTPVTHSSVPTTTSYGGRTEGAGYL